MATILLVEDDARLRQMLTQSLGGAGFAVEAVMDAEEGLRRLAGVKPDLLLLDLMLPGMSGFELLQRLRADGVMTPVLMLTARGAVEDRVKGLTAGADDYLSKPFALVELIARVHALLRRAPDRSERPQTLTCGRLKVDFAALRASEGDRVLDLSPREFRLLEALLQRAGRTLSRQELLQQAWPSDARPSPRTVDVHILGLRRQLATVEDRTWIATIGGEGYRWVPEVGGA